MKHLSYQHCVLDVQEEVSSGGSEEEEEEEDGNDDDDDEDRREMEDIMFAQDYLHRVRTAPVSPVSDLLPDWCRELMMCFHLQVCEAVQVSPGLSEQLLQVLDQFSSAGSLKHLYGRLSVVLRAWPQLLRDFAAFLNRGQARRCGLVSDITLTSLMYELVPVQTFPFCFFVVFFKSVVGAADV